MTIDSESETVEMIPTNQEPAIVIEPIMFFDMNQPSMVFMHFIGEQKVKFGHTLKTNDLVLKSMSDRGYKLVSTEKQGTIVYGIFQK